MFTEEIIVYAETKRKRYGQEAEQAHLLERRPFRLRLADALRRFTDRLEPTPARAYRSVSARNAFPQGE